MSKIMTISIILLALLILAIIFLVVLNPAFGGSPKGERLKRIEQSPNATNGKFQNPLPTPVQTNDVPYLKLMKEFASTSNNKVPQTPIKTRPIDRNYFGLPTEKIQVSWLGHSTVLLNIDGLSILTDPVFSKRTSPFSFVGTKAFPYTHNYNWDKLPKIDLIIISHDHYDHLDYEAIKQLKDKQTVFLTTLGVGAHLERWGIAPDRITELDWWEDFEFTSKIKITATPARHFSGRGLTNRFSTLWASWVIQGASQNVFFGADSGYFPGFKQIGERFGPFDFAMLECGQYSPYWPLIHMAPEETYQAAKDLQAEALLPIHWGKYKLSIHPWTEPVERLLQAATDNALTIATPEIGQVFPLESPYPGKHWWNNSETN